MGSRVPVEHYDLRTATNSYIGSSLNDLNVGDDEDRESDGVAVESLSNDASSAVVSDCMHESYRSSLPLHSILVEEDRSSLEHNVSSRCPYNILTIDDVSPIESARARFLDIIVDNFIDIHVIERSDYEADYMMQQSSQEKLNKRKSGEFRYEGDAHYALPLMYIANMYETLVNEVNMRLSSVNGMRGKTIGMALEAAGGLYRKLAKKFPREGTCAFKRRELATSFETRSRFPELVIQEEKRVRFVVVNGLTITERPTKIGADDAEWFKRLTGRNEVAVSAGDYMFYAPRHKYRRVVSNSNNITSLPNTEQTPTKQHMQPIPHQVQFHPLHQSHQSHINHNPQATHFMHNHQCVPEISHNQDSSTVPKNIACLQPLGHVGGHLHVLATSPAKFCDECGAPYLRETSKFCSECGTKRLGI